MTIRIGIDKRFILIPGSSTPAPIGYRLIEDGNIVYKKWMRSGFYVIDYSDDGGATWELDLVNLYPTEDNIIILIDDGVAGYQDLVRAGAYEIQKELTPTGFAGTEDIDWVVDYYLKPM